MTFLLSYRSSGLGLILSPLFFIVQRTAVLFLVLSLMACEPAPTSKSIIISGPIMGTDYRVSLVIYESRSDTVLDNGVEGEKAQKGQKVENGLDRDQAINKASLEQGILKAMEAVNQSMSTYIKTSELSQFNANTSVEPLSLSPMLLDVVTESLDLAKLTDGAFDVTVKPIVDLWGFGPSVGTETLPDGQLIKSIQRFTGYNKLSLEGDFLTKSHPKLSVDLSAIAKGYAVDQVASYLISQGVNNFLINIGGELKASGRNQDGHVWRVGIEKPKQLGGVQQIIKLTDKAIATSGDYRNFVMIDGQAFSHTIDPRLGKPIHHKLASVSVINDNASTADALATALMVMGEQQGFEFAVKQGIAAFFIIREGEQYEIRFTEKITPYLL